MGGWASLDWGYYLKWYDSIFDANHNIGGRADSEPSVSSGGLFGASQSGLASLSSAQNGFSGSTTGNRSGLSNRPYVAGEVIVQLAPDAPKGLAQRFGAEIGMESALFGIQLWQFKTDAPIEHLVEALRRSPWIVYADPNYLLTVSDFVPNDPSFGNQWGLHNGADHDIDAPAAWDVGTDASNIVVAVIDTGIDYKHPDLDDNLWVNPDEIPGNGFDDDDNGIVDDVHGVNYVTATPSGDPLDDHGHGTHVSGTIGAEGNNGIGVAGVAWSVQLMALKVFDSSGSGDVAKVIEALDYAVTNGARISNNSWGFTSSDTGFIDTLRSAIDQAGQMGHLFVAAAGNDANNNDTNPVYPASYDLDNVISVAATDPNDKLWVFKFFGVTLAGSNYGQISVDLAAPGVDIYSTLPGGGYGYNTGTSMATPHVTGAAALIWAQDPSMTPLEVREILLSTVDVLPSLKNKVATDGRLNLANAINAVEVSVTALDDSATILEDGAVTLDVLANDTDTENDPLTVEIASGPANGAVVVNPDNTVTYTPDPDFFGTDSFDYFARDPGGQADRATVTVTVTGVQDPPVAVDDAMETNEDEPAVFDLLANDVDVDGDALTIVSLTDPANGSVALNADGTVTYTPATGFVGEDSFSYTIEDGNGGSDTALVTVTVDPEAIGEFGSVSLDHTITTVQLDNTYENPVVFLFVETAVGTDIITPRITNITNDSFDAFLQEANYLSPGTHGVEQVNYFVIEQGRWTLSDGTVIEAGVVNTSTVYTSTNPQGFDPISFSRSFESAPLLLTQVQSDNDLDWVVTRVRGITSNGFELALANEMALISGHEFEQVGYLALQPGSGSLNGYELASFVQDGFTHQQTSVGSLFDVHFAAMQTTNGSDTAIVREAQTNGESWLYIQEEQSSSAETNHGPETVAIFGFSAPFGDLLAPAVRALDDFATLPEDTTFILAVLSNDLLGGTDPSSLTLSISDTPEHGTAVVNPDQTISYRPDLNFFGEDSFSYTVTAATGGSDTATVFLTVENVQDPPTAVDDSGQTTAGMSISLDVLANDTDPDGDTLTVTSTSNPANGVATINEDGTVTYTPSSGFSGADAFSYTISDGNGGSATADVSITVDAQQAMVIGEFGSISLNHNMQTVSLDHVYTDPIVFLFVETAVGTDIVTPRVTSVSSTSFDVFLQEANYLSPGTHGFEQVNYLVVEAGRWTLPDGTILEAGTVDTSIVYTSRVKQGFDSVGFSQSFAQAPVLLTQVQTYNDPDWVVTRVHNIGSDGFDLALANEMAFRTGHGLETVGFLAIEPGEGSGEAFSFTASTVDGFTHVPTSVGTLFDIHFAAMQTTNGSDTAIVRESQTNGVSSIYIQEEQSSTKEVKHGPETVGFVGFQDTSGADELVAFV